MGDLNNVIAPINVDGGMSLANAIDMSEMTPPFWSMSLDMPMALELNNPFLQSIIDDRVRAEQQRIHGELNVDKSRYYGVSPLIEWRDRLNVHRKALLKAKADYDAIVYSGKPNLRG